MRYVLGADVGTSFIKCLLFDERGALVAAASRDYPSTHRRPGWSEQDAEDWLRALGEAIRAVLSRIENASDVVALSLATQGGTLVPVDRDGSPLCAAIVWNDTRCVAERALLDEEYVWDKTGWTLGQGLNALQILWLKRNRQEIFKRTHRFLSVPDFLSLRLTGICAIDPSNAGINQLADIGRNSWDERLLEEVGIHEDSLSRIVNSGEVIGHLTHAGAEALGLTERTLLISGGHDQYCSALGAGAMADGDVFIATGTCWVVARIGDTRPSHHCVSRHTVKSLWGSLLSHPSGGASLEWLRRQLSSDGTPMDYEQINAAVAAVPPGARGLCFYPYLTGVTYPVADAALRGAFIGLDTRHTQGDMLRAVMEGVCLQARWMMDGFETERLKSVRVTGGASHSEPWMRMLSGVTALPVATPTIADSGCVGAAVLAGVASGMFGSHEEGVTLLNPDGRMIVAPPEEVAVYRDLFDRYRENYALLHRMMC